MSVQDTLHRILSQADTRMQQKIQRMDDDALKTSYEHAKSSDNVYGTIRMGDEIKWREEREAIAKREQEEQMRGFLKRLNR